MCWVWALGGVWIGAMVGYFMAAMMAVAKRADREMGIDD